MSKHEEDNNTPEDPRLVIIVENGEVSSVFDERSDKYLDEAQLKDVYTLDSLFLGRAPRWMNAYSAGFSPFSH